MRVLLSAALCSSVLCSYALNAPNGPDDLAAGTTAATAADATTTATAPAPLLVENVPMVGTVALSTSVMPLLPAPGEAALIGGGGPTNPMGENALAPDGLCCMFSSPPCPNTPGSYVSGDEIYLNCYWTEILPSDPGTDWVNSITIGIQLPDGTPVTLLADQRISFGDLSFAAGQQLTFCLALNLTIPELSGSFDPVGQSFGVVSEQGGFSPVVVNSFSVN